MVSLSPEDLLPSFACTAQSTYGDGWNGSAALLSSRSGMNWERVMEQAHNLGNKRRLFIGLLLASALLGIALPEEVWEGARADPLAKSLVREVRDRLFSEAEPQLFERWFRYRVRERWRDR